MVIEFKNKRIRLFWDLNCLFWPDDNSFLYSIDEILWILMVLKEKEFTVFLFIVENYCMKINSKRVKYENFLTGKKLQSTKKIF